MRDSNPLEQILADRIDAAPPQLDGWMHISAAAAYLGVSPDALRSWDRRGLLKARRDALGWRIYHEEDLEDAYAKYYRKRKGPFTA